VIYLLVFAATCLASARLTRAFNIDEVFAPLRSWIVNRYGVASKPGKIVRCYWCAGFWVSLLCTTYAQVAICAAGWLPWQTVALLPITGPAVAYASGWLLDKEEAANGV
jgi:hypothetical protein